MVIAELVPLPLAVAEAVAEAEVVWVLLREVELEVGAAEALRAKAIKMGSIFDMANEECGERGRARWTRFL